MLRARGAIRDMRNIVTSHKQGKYIILAASVCSLLFLFGLFSNVGAAPKDNARNGRLITIHDRGQERVILTHAQNVRDALTDANVPVVDDDRIEPSLDTELISTNYTVNIYRARPVIVIDGVFRQKIMTAAQTKSAIVTAAGLELNDEDMAELSQSQNIVGDGASVILTLDRATQFTLNLYGKTATAYTQGKTVGEMLERKRVVLGKDDSVSVDLDTPITPGMTVSVNRDGVQTVTVEESVAFPVRKIHDASQPASYRKINSPGTDGKKLVTYEITVENGKEMKRVAIQKVVIEQPKEQIEIVGVALPPGSHQDWMAAAGIAPSDFGFVNYIVNHENRSWNPCVVQGGSVNCSDPGTANRGYGLVQATPGKKMASAGSDWQTNPITQLKWAHSYAIGRYGSWQEAYNFKVSKGWW